MSLYCDPAGIVDSSSVTVTRRLCQIPDRSREFGHGDSAIVTDQAVVTPVASQLVLSIFPGIDLFGRGFEAEGFSVVRGPDPLFGGDIRSFHIPRHRFDGIIGGPPCPDFSKARRTAPSGYGMEMLEEYVRIVKEGNPLWWLMENVPGVPDVVIDGYSHQRIDLNAREVGLAQNRPRHFQFGHRDGLVISVPRGAKLSTFEACCVASEGTGVGRRDWERFCRLQGLDEPLQLDQLTLSARYRAVGNGVPIHMSRALAKAVLNATSPEHVRLCGCGCGRPVQGKAIYAIAACRKRVQRRNVTDQVRDLAGASL